MKDIEFTQFRQKGASPKNICCLYGANTELVHSAVRQVSEIIIKDSSKKYEITRISSEKLSKDPTILMDFFSDVSLFGTPRILEVSGLNEKFRKLVNTLIKNPNIQPSNDFIVFSSTSVRRQSQILNDLRSSNYCTIISTYEDSMTRAEIQNFLTFTGIDNIPNDILQALAEIARSYTYNEMKMLLEKLSISCANDNAVDPQTFSEIFEGAEANDVDYLDSLLSGNVGKALQSLKIFLQNHGEPSSLSAILNRHLFEILQHNARQNKMLNFRLQKTLSSAQRKFSDLPNRIEYAMKELQAFECKSRISGLNTHMEIERCFIRICHLFSKA